MEKIYFALGKKYRKFKRKRIIIHHKSFDYLEILGCTVSASLEVKPGIPPTASHLKNILENINNNPADIIVYLHNRLFKKTVIKTN